MVQFYQEGEWLSFTCKETGSDLPGMSTAQFYLREVWLSLIWREYCSVLPGRSIV
jgi:hypothetical protein